MPATPLYTIRLDCGSLVLVFASGESIRAEFRPRYTLQSEEPITAARSTKVSAALEVSSLLALIVLEIWIVRGVNQGSTSTWLWLAIGAIYAWSLRRRGYTEFREAFRIGPLRPWLESAVATAAALLVAVAWLAVAAEPYDGLELEPFRRPPLEIASWVLRRLTWAVWQQLVLQTFLWPNLRELLGSDRRATVASGAIFGLLCLPVVALMAVTTVCGWLWTVLFRRGRRLLPVTLSHAILVSFASIAVPPRVFHDMRVGVDAVRSLPRYRVLASDRAREILRVVTSEEYYRAQGGTDRQWIAALYRDILGREPASSEFDFWIRWKEIRDNRRVARHFIISNEFLALQEEYGERYRFPFRRQHPESGPSPAGGGTDGRD